MILTVIICRREREVVAGAAVAVVEASGAAALDSVEDSAVDSGIFFGVHLSNMSI